MVKEFRVPVGDYVYGLPAGLIDPGENIENTVRREIHEETGFEVTAIKRITPPLYSSSGLTDETAAMAFVDVRSTPQSKQALEGSEDIEVLLLDFEQLCAGCATTPRNGMTRKRGRFFTCTNNSANSREVSA